MLTERFRTQEYHLTTAPIYYDKHGTNSWRSFAEINAVKARILSVLQRTNLSLGHSSHQIHIGILWDLKVYLEKFWLGLVSIEPSYRMLRGGILKRRKTFKIN
jgi:hypothetical protein